MLNYFTILLLFAMVSCKSTTVVDTNQNQTTTKTYTMPDESSVHEGTWLQWPHQYQYGTSYRNELDATWVAMTKELISSEKVHLIVYDETEKTRVSNLLNAEKVSFNNIDFRIYKTDDVWVRDNGPIFVRNENSYLAIEDWGFNGWGNKAKFDNCNQIPTKIALADSKLIVDLNKTMILEGGAFEIDGNGTFLATKSAVLNKNRNASINQTTAETYFKQFLGVSNFIWLEGVSGLEITDQHIDGFARFSNPTTIVTMSASDLLEYDVTQNDINTLFAAKNKNNVAYNFVKLPLTKKNVVTTAGKDLGYKGSYVNFYIANTKVLVPNYNDANDAIANAKVQELYPSKSVVGIDVRNLYANGGMVHCVTMQQPL